MINIKAKTNFTTLYLDMKNNSICFYMVNQMGHIIQDARNINAKFLSDEYFEKFTNILKEVGQKYTPSNSSSLTVVLPDECIFMSTVSLPNQKSSDQKVAYNAYITNTYKNQKELNIIPSKVVYNKQFVTFSLVGIQKDIIDKIKFAFQNAKLVVQNITFASDAMIAGVNALSTKYRSQTYMLLDIKENEAKYIIVSKGKTIGFFTLPIGYSSLVEKPAQEDVLLYSPAAELVVVNAKEKANRKELTMSGADNVTEVAQSQDPFESEDVFDDEENAFAGSDSFTPRVVEQTIKTLPKKVGRKLPKFMIREVPDDSERKIYENFRIFMKWGLDILENNEKLSFAKPQTIYVNLPGEFSYLFDFANEEAEENKVKFTSAGFAKEKQEITDNLEKFGGLYVKDYKQTTLF